MKSLLFDHVSRITDYKYLVLITGALGIAYYISSYVLSPDAQKIYPEQIQMLMNQANNALFSKQYVNAIAAYDQVIAYDEHCAAAYFNKGQSLFHLERWKEACSCYQKALASGMRPEYLHLLHFNYSLALFRLNDATGSIEHASKAISYQPFAPAYAQRALAYEMIKKYDAAYESITQACELAFEPTYAQALVKIGNGLRDQNDFEKAAHCYRDSIRYQPHNANTYLALADALHLQSKKMQSSALFDDAITHYKKATELDPLCYLGYHNLACMLLEKEDEVQAFSYMEKVFACAPDHCATHLLASCYYLQNGDFERGWREYEWRNRGENPSRHDNNPLWNGSSLTGKTILLHAEQGFGDTFQFIRYAQLVKNLGPKKLIVEVQHALKKIAQRCAYIDEVTIPSDPMPAYDLHAPIMSLPAIMKTTLKTIPHQVPYLYADEQLIPFWRNQLATNRSFKIGICWQVDPHHDLMKYRNSNVTLSVITPLRTIPLSFFESIASMQGLTLYCLQKEIRVEDQALAEKIGLKQFGSDYDKSHGAFMDTAAIMKSLDLVITADTSIAHLAGGLGIPVWIILPYAAEWRWLKKRNDSPWYPTARLFRQKKGGDWESAMCEVRAELKTVIKR